MQAPANSEMLPNVTARARSYVKGVVARTPLGQPLQAWYRRRRAIRDLGVWTPRDENARRFYSQLLRPGDLCFDIGANRGSRTKVFRRLAARVVAVEPQSSCMAVLRGAYKNDPQVTLVQAACGSIQGQGRLRVCELDELSSLSDEWIAAVSESGRFDKEGWTKQEHCAVVTLDGLIQEHGAPAFVKIDVEGYELHVLQGLTRPIGCVSFEFTPERFETALACVEHLHRLGLREFNVSWAESFELALEAWAPPDRLAVVLDKYREDKVIFGDVYARNVAAQMTERRGS